MNRAWLSPGGAPQSSLIVSGRQLSGLVRTAGPALLFGLRPNDAGSLALAAGALAVVTLAASYVPARRASRLEPMAALREE